jgi:ribonuclease HIII
MYNFNLIWGKEGVRMVCSINFVYPKEDAKIILIDFLHNNGFNIMKEQGINNGAGIKLHILYNNIKFALIIYFNSKTNLSTKIVLEKETLEIKEKIECFLAHSSNFKKSGKPMPVHSSVFICDNEQREVLKRMLLNSGYIITKQKVDKHKDYVFKVEEFNNTLTLTQFSNGTLLLQGSYSNLVDKTVEMIEKVKPLTEMERALLFVPIEGQGFIKEDLENSHGVFDIAKETSQKELDEAFNYLFENDKKSINTGVALIEILKDNPKKLPEYNFVVALFAKAFEGFIIKMMIDKDFFSLEDYKEKPDIAKIGNALRGDKLKKFIIDQKRYGYISEKMIAIWEGTRCKEMHSDPIGEETILSVDNLQTAIDKVGEIKQCIREAYHIIIKLGYTNNDLKELEACKAKQTRLEYSNVNCRIGTDESGKGDYFGPLSIAGVAINETDERKLLSIGVKDSKLIRDDKILFIANEIRKVLPMRKYQVVFINPEKYNKLYNEMKNLNKILAWGHARVLENLLQNNNCELAIADQFGDPEYINKALMEKGKKVKLIQMPKAERDVAVAAASILARDTYLKKIKHMSEHYDLDIPKGASAQVEYVAKKIVEKYGKDELHNTSKMHFKTTKRVLNNE